MINAASNAFTTSCQKCKSKRHATKDCKSDHYSYCDRWFHKVDDCFVIPKSPNFKGDVFASQFWVKAGKQPPAPPPAAATPGGTIAIAAIKNGTLVQNAPTPRSMATQTNTDQSVSILPDSGATLNIACRASCLKWGLQIEELAPREASLTDV